MDDPVTTPAMHESVTQALPKQSTFECSCCRTRVPSTWVDYDILGYSICPECGATQSPLTGLRFAAGGAIQ